MPKKLIQDIVIRKAAPRVAPPETPAPRPQYGAPIRPVPPGSSGSSGFWGKKKIGGLVVILAVGIFFFVSSSFASVAVSITPRQIPVTLAGDTFSAQRGENASGVHFEIMTLEDEASRNVPSTGTQKVERKAKGSIIVYNTYDKSPQQLVAGTRFEAPNGKIYKADAGVTVPGMKQEGGKDVAGSVVVAVTAAEAGEEYNIGLGDFSIPGFKGTPRYEKFYGRSKSEMTGGFVGTTKVARDTDIIDARHTLEADLKKSLLERAKKEVPKGYLFYEGADFYTISFPDGSNAAATSTDVTVHGKATLYGMIVDRASLASAIGAKKTDDAAADLDIANPEALTLSVDNSTAFDPSIVSNLTLKLTGAVGLEGRLDEGKLVEALSGLPKGQFPEVLKSYPMIERAEADFSPAWSRSFPSDTSRISIIRSK